MTTYSSEHLLVTKTFNFSGSYSSTLSLMGRPARAMHLVRRILGNSATLWLLRRLPLRKPAVDGLLVVPTDDVYLDGGWALIAHDKDWYSFICARAETEMQRKVWRDGGATIDLSACPTHIGETK